MKHNVPSQALWIPLTYVYKPDHVSSLKDFQQCGCLSILYYPLPDQTDQDILEPLAKLVAKNNPVYKNRKDIRMHPTCLLSLSSNAQVSAFSASGIFHLKIAPKSQQVKIKIWTATAPTPL